MTLQCSCCPIPTDECWESVVQLPFQSVVVSNNPGGLSITNLASTIDGSAGSDLSGFSPPASAAQLAANPTTAIDYVFAAPQPDVNRLRWFNGGGGVLTDQDGFGLVTFQLLDPANVVLYQSNWDLTQPIGNNAIVREITFQPVDNVKTIRFTNFHKQNDAVMGTGSPLLRQFQAFAVAARPVWPCRDRLAPNTLRWFDATGTEVAAAADVVPCSESTPPTPLPVSNLVMSTAALGDDGGAGENLCNITPVPSSMTGFTPSTPGCFDPATAGVKSMTWNGPLTSVDLTYSSQGVAGSGAALFSFAATGVGTVNWTANATPMIPGAARRSLPLVGGGYAELTYLPPGGSPASGAPRFDGGANIRMGPGAVQAFQSYRFRLDFYS